MNGGEKKHAARDAERKELIKAVNNAESVLHDIASTLEKFGSQLNQSEVGPLFIHHHI